MALQIIVCSTICSATSRAVPRQIWHFRCRGTFL